MWALEFTMLDGWMGACMHACIYGKMKHIIQCSQDICLSRGWEISTRLEGQEGLHPFLCLERRSNLSLRRLLHVVLMVSFLFCREGGGRGKEEGSGGREGERQNSNASGRQTQLWKDSKSYFSGAPGDPCQPWKSWPGATTCQFFMRCWTACLLKDI